MLHVSATQETERSDRRMAAQGVRFSRCAHLALQTVYVEDRPLARHPCQNRQTSSQPGQGDKEQGSPLNLTSYIVPPCSTRLSSVS